MAKKGAPIGFVVVVILTALLCLAAAALFGAEH